MDFSKSSKRQLLYFLEKNKLSVDPQIPITNLIANVKMLSMNLDIASVDAFIEIIVDLYTALKLEQNADPDDLSNIRYSKEQIRSMSYDKLNEFTDIMGLELTLEDELDMRKRVERILDFLEVLYPIDIKQLFDEFEQCVFFYKINTNVNIDNEVTIDLLYRHKFENFPENIDINYLEIVSDDANKYLTFKMELNDENDTISSDEYGGNSMLSTKENLIKLAGDSDMKTIISENGKLLIPGSFKDFVTYQSLQGEMIDYNEVDVLFTFDHMECKDRRIKNYIDVSGV